jgi:hypothetical protein
MAGLPYKNGLNPVKYGKAAEYSAAMNVYRTSVANAAIYFGAPVRLTANGAVVVATSATEDVLGVAVGGFWFDKTSKKPVESRYVPAATSSARGVYNGIRFTTGAEGAGAGVMVIDDLDQVYAVKFTTSVPMTALSDNADIVNSGGDTVTGISNFRASIGGDADSLLEIVGVLRTEEFITATSTGGNGINDWAAPETVALVKLRKN